MYIENCSESEYFKYIRAKYDNHMDELKKISGSSENIHIILVNNILNISNRCMIVDKVKYLIDKYGGDNLLIIYYGESVNILCPEILLIDKIIEPLSNIINIDYDYNCIYNENIVINAINNREKICEIDFKFLNKYNTIYIHN